MCIFSFSLLILIEHIIHHLKPRPILLIFRIHEQLRDKSAYKIPTPIDFGTH